MTKARFVITTVGTSLIEKLGREYIDGQYNKLYDNTTYENIKITCKDNNGNSEENIYKTMTSDVNSGIKKLSELNSSTDHIFAPAEIASLWKLNLDGANDNIALLYSDTCEGVFCSVVLMEYVKTKINIICERKKVNGLQSKDSKKFKDTGLKNLAKIVAEYIKMSQDKEIILNLTGGYKGIVPHLTLMGICEENIKIVYLYEESDGIIEMPLLPFNIDFTLWNDNRAFIRILPHIKGIYNKSEQLPVAEKLKGLFEIDSSGKITTSIYHEILEERYGKAKQEKALSEFGRGYILADLIQDIGGKDRLKKWINNSQNIWYGDGIPETVDHSRGHCQRLLELAAQIIRPIEAVTGKPFLTDDELIILTLTLWFHDIGHSGREMIKDFKDDTVEKLLNGNDIGCNIDISDFPTANRDLHHILGFVEALKKPEYYGFKDDGGDGFLSTAYLKPSIYAYLYHRKSMPKSNGDKQYSDVFNVKITKEIPETWIINNNAITIRLRFLAALQAFIDECDNSRERTGDAEFIKRRRRQTEKEIKTEYEKLKRLYKHLGNSVKETFEPIVAILKNESNEFLHDKELLERHYDLKGTKVGNEPVGKKLNCLIESSFFEQSDDPVFYGMASTLNKLIFKLVQNWHIDKSARYKSVFIIPDDPFKPDDTCFNFNIVIESNENIFKDAIAAVNDICEQYKRVENILKEGKIKISKIKWFDESGTSKEENNIDDISS